MKRLLTALTAIVSATLVNAQLPKWLIAPTGDTIFVKVDNTLLQTLERGKSSLWSMDGKLLYSTENTILPYKDGVATIVNADTTKLLGLVDTAGKFTVLPALSVAFGNPYFENGFLAATTDGTTVFYSKDGTKALFPESIRAYPFHSGYAPFLAYEQPDKMKEPHYGYRRADGQPISYRMITNGEMKNVDPKSIEFLSGIGSNGKGVAVIKGKIYWFNPENETFEPFLRGTEESEKKRHLTISREREEDFLNLPAGEITIWAKYGKKQTAILRFDRELLPTLFTFDDGEIIFSKTRQQPAAYTSGLSVYGNFPYGLALDSTEVLPPQFEATGLLYGNRAFVKFNGKWGVVEIIPQLNYTIRINKGEDVAFRHQKFETQIRLDLPAEISAKDARIEIPDSTGCTLDKTSRETKNTESGNFVTYNCDLNIPASLPDTITTLTYSPVSISYDGLKLFDTNISIKAWHLKYYNVDPIESETTISNGVASFTLNINAQKNAGESDYPFEVKIEADSVSVEYEKLSETRYKCLVSNLLEGDNSLNIVVTEKGCPPSVFPFEITYTKPVPRQKKKEEVVIRKKTPATKKRSPRLEI